MQFDVTPISAAPSAVADTAAETAAADAYAMALRVLGARAMASGRLRERLIDKGVERDAAEQAVQRIVDDGYLDDRAVAADAVERLRERKQLGDRAIRQELMKLGVGSDVAEAVLKDAPAEDPIALAQEAADARAPRLRGLDRETAERRLLSYLQRRGHSGRIAAVAAAAALDEVSSARRTVRFE